MNSETSQRVAELSANLPTMSTELQAAVEYASTDPGASLNKCRLVLERTLKAVIAFEGFLQSGKSLMVGQLLHSDAIKAAVPPAIRASMTYVNIIASEQGAHPGSPTPENAFHTLDHWKAS